MRIIFSRKGFDSAAGRAPSPIIDGEPIGLPIPTMRRSDSTYGLIGLGDVVAHITKGRLGADDLCHEDPMFHEGRCAFGQTGAAQAHLAKQASTAIRPSDVSDRPMSEMRGYRNPNHLRKSTGH
jgi:hypothetical protein